MLFWKKKKAKPQPKPSVKKQEISKESPLQWKPTYVPPTTYTTQKDKKTENENPKKIVNSTYAPKHVEKHDSTKEFLSMFDKLTYRHRAWDVWRDFIVMFACAVSNPMDKTHYEEREERYIKIINKYNKQEQKIFPELAAQTIMAMEENPEQDFLGDMFMNLNLGNKANGQFFTPYHICQLMADITIGDCIEEIKEKGFISIYDSCCGAGATLIAGIHSARKQLEKADPPLNFQNHVLVVGQDVDETVALMCYIQLSFLGVAGYVKIGNSLTNPITNEDTYENYWFTPMYFSDVWTYRRMFHSL